jgi:hypothetical protein
MCKPISWTFFTFSVTLEEITYTSLVGIQGRGAKHSEHYSLHTNKGAYLNAEAGIINTVGREDNAKRILFCLAAGNRSS